VAEERRAGRRFLRVEMIHMFSDRPGLVFLSPHVGPGGYVGEIARVKASSLECRGCVVDAVCDRGMVSFYMRLPADCELKDDTLVCRPARETGS